MAWWFVRRGVRTRRAGPWRSSRAACVWSSGVDDHCVSPAHVRAVVAAAHPTGTVIPPSALRDRRRRRGSRPRYPGRIREDRPDMRVAGEADRPQRQRARVLQPLRGIPPSTGAAPPTRSTARSSRRSMANSRPATVGAVGSDPVRPLLASLLHPTASTWFLAPGRSAPICSSNTC